ncbi:hypothetical protein [Gelidibacter sp. F63206]|uniref:hypothetical protein n=1 Tax=Gelidibacter sp. F63206 TaxID=2926425 RepID=UPI001FF3DE45|nr:hypothetical protein [Gelidibacter sp. F63206]MCK0115073.1 hypothetical protein [Gelidibacter sp. F63206]
MLTINLSRIRNLPIENKDDCLLDIPNSINQEEKLNVSDFYNQDDLYKGALNLYKEFIDQIVSQKNILSYNINGLPIYWLSDTGSKHPIYHWGKDFFLLLTLLKYSSETIQEEYRQLTLILPNELLCFENSIRKLLVKYKYDISVQILFLAPIQSKTNFKSILKSSISVIKSILLYRNNKVYIKANSNNYYLINSLKNKLDYNGQYLELKKIFTLENKVLSIIPVLEWRLQHSPAPETPQEFIDKKPNIIEILNTLFQLLNLSYKIKRTKFKEIKIDGIDFTLNFLKEDLLATLQNKSDLVFLHVWLDNFFKTQNASFLYSDEFYPYGKTISSAVNHSQNHKAYSYGIQHGNFSEVHTVYMITDKEIDAGLPLPNKFIVWGNYYKEMFKQNNSLNNDYILPLGNPKYINSGEKVDHKKGSITIKNILWCLTTLDCFVAEWTIIKHSVTLPNIKLTIRLHPGGHVKAENLLEVLKDAEYNISREKNLIDDFRMADLILTSAHSTVFLDALITKNKVVRLITNRWVGSNNIQSNYIFNVKDSEELHHLFLKLENMTNDKEYKDDFIEINNNKWRKFVNKND